MTLSLQEDLERQVCSQAAQVALEFLRTNPPASAEEATKQYNKIFEEVYRKTNTVINK